MPEVNWEGKLEAIQIAPVKSGPISQIEHVEARESGLAGDRERNRPGRVVTLISADVLDDIKKETGLELSGADTRRNFVTRGVPLNDLIGSQFRIGDVLFQGTGLCHPCLNMSRLCGKKGAMLALVGRGGLNAIVIESGTIRVGDTVRPEK